jgi:dipeptidyl aminopeptidase/acylaminoacyl peptidase
VLHVEDGIHRLGLLDTATGEVELVRTGTGSYAEPDVASPATYYSTSHLASDGSVRVFEQTWGTPPRLVALDDRGAARELFTAGQIQAGQPLESVMVTSRDGTAVQLWWATPPGPALGTVIEVHGGPNLVTTDHYSPEAQAWLAEGFAYAAVNYRGSVTFGRDFREGFWGGAGDREIEDVQAALDWLRGVGLADPATTFITGESYGGHLSLLSAGRLPDDFAGALARVAMADWSAAVAEMNPAVRATWISFLTSPQAGIRSAHDPRCRDREVQPDQLRERGAGIGLDVPGNARYPDSARPGRELRQRATRQRRGCRARVVRRRARAGRAGRTPARAAKDAGSRAREARWSPLGSA